MERPAQVTGRERTRESAVLHGISAGRVFTIQDGHISRTGYQSAADITPGFFVEPGRLSVYLAEFRNPATLGSTPRVARIARGNWRLMASDDRVVTSGVSRQRRGTSGPIVNTLGEAAVPDSSLRSDLTRGDWCADS